jgi:arylsulfatase A-like enzyme
MFHKPPSPILARFLPVLSGAAIFLIYQYALALWNLSHTSSGMENKFSALAKNEYMGFLILQNLQMIVAYLVLAVLGTLIVQPFVNEWTRHSLYQKPAAIILRSLIIITIIHGYFTLRLVDTRPYFLSEGEYGQWYYKALDFIPHAIKPAALCILFTILPLAVVGYVIYWQMLNHSRRVRLAVVCMSASLIGWFAITRTATQFRRVPVAKAKKALNVIIIGSDSLRGDSLGCAGYIPRRHDGLAKDGVSPFIDSLAAKSVRFENCYTAIASTMESGTQLMSSEYPQTDGIRYMYPDRATVDATMKRIVPIATLLRKKGYDTTAIGDWCAGYYEVVPLGFEHFSISSFDNFKIYMSQAVVMAHFVVPLYFDNSLGYRLFPQLESFAQFVTPQVVTQRVEKRLRDVAKSGKPFFWHVFYSCNHLPYGSTEPYNTMFADPAYQGKNRSKVDFDIDSFIGGTDLESKWKALPPKEVQQIRALYDGCTRRFDDCVKQIVASLRKNGLEDNTVVIVTADHGDDQYEPGVTLGHGLTFNGGLQANHVPMIVHVPGLKPQVIKETVRLIDVIPTIADLLGLKKPSVWQGQSFAGWLKGTEKPIYRPFYGETGFPFIQFKVPGVERPKLPSMDELTFIDKNFNYQFVLKDKYREPLIYAKQRCLKTQRWKIVCTPTAQGARHFGLFQLDADRYGEHDLATKRPEVLAPMRAALGRWMDQQIETPIATIFPNGEPE